MDYRPVNLQAPINRQHLLARGLAAWWLALPGWMGGVTWHDLCGLSHGTLTSMGNTSNGWRGTTRPGGFGHILFDGSSGYVSVGNAAPVGVTSRFTFAAWAQRNYSTAADRWFFGKDDNSLGRSYDFGTHSSGGNTVLCVQINGTNRPSGGSTFNIATTGVWYHCVATYDGTNVQYYFNGKADGSGPYASVDCATSTAPLRIGERSFSGSANPWQGALDDVRIYNRCLSSVEVFQLYADSLAGAYAALRRVG